MRIGLFSDTYTPEINGVVTSIVTLQKELERQGHTVFVVTTNNSALHIQKDGNILRLPGLELKKLYGYRISSPFSVIGLNDVKEMKLDVIHVHTEFGIGTFARIVSKLLSIPIVATYHTMYEEYTHYINLIQSETLDNVLKNLAGGLSKIYGQLCHELIAPSEKTKKALEGYGIENEIHVIPTGLDLTRFDKQNFTPKQVTNLRNELGIKDDEYILLYVGRVAEEKSIDVIIRANKLIKEQQLKVKTVIVGGGPGIPDLKALAKELDVEDFIIFTDKKPASDVPLYYHIADMFVSASLTETQGLTFIEAMASGNCVFAAEKEVLSDLIIDKETGYYFDNEVELVEKINYYLALSPNEQARLKEAAQKQIEPLDSRIFGKKVVDVYLSAIVSHKDLFMIEKVKVKKTNYYELTLRNEVETKKLLIYIETFYKEGLEKDMLVKRSKVEKFEQESNWINAYNSAVSYLATKDRTRKEMYDYLTQKFELPIEEVNKMIEKFEEMKYVDDDRYLSQQISAMKTMLIGRKKIISTLVKKGIPYEKIDEALSSDDSINEMENAIMMIEKTLPTLKRKNTASTKVSLEHKLERQGFGFDTIKAALSLVDFSKDPSDEKALLKKEYKKIEERLSKKYADKELKNKVITTLIRKGYEYDQVIGIMEEDNEID